MTARLPLGTGQSRFAAALLLPGVKARPAPESKATPSSSKPAADPTPFAHLRPRPGARHPYQPEADAEPAPPAATAADMILAAHERRLQDRDEHQRRMAARR